MTKIKKINGNKRNYESFDNFQFVFKPNRALY